MLQVSNAEVRFDNVVFSYTPSSPVLKGVSFAVPGTGTESVGQKVWGQKVWRQKVWGRRFGWLPFLIIV